MSLIYLSKVEWSNQVYNEPQYAEHHFLENVIAFTRVFDLSKVTINTKILTPKREVLGVIHWDEREY